MARSARTRPNQAMLAAATAVLACAVIGVLLGAYLNEVRAEGPQRPLHPLPSTTSPSTSVSTTVSTIVVTVPQGTDTVIRPPRDVAERHNSPKAPRPAPPPPRTVTVTAPPPAATTDCAGLLDCLINGAG